MELTLGGRDLRVLGILSKSQSEIVFLIAIPSFTLQAGDLEAPSIVLS